MNWCNHWFALTAIWSACFLLCLQNIEYLSYRAILWCTYIFPIIGFNDLKLQCIFLVLDFCASWPFHTNKPLGLRMAFQILCLVPCCPISSTSLTLPPATCLLNLGKNKNLLCNLHHTAMLFNIGLHFNLCLPLLHYSDVKTKTDFSAKGVRVDKKGHMKWPNSRGAISHVSNEVMRNI